MIGGETVACAYQRNCLNFRTSLRFCLNRRIFLPATKLCRKTHYNVSGEEKIAGVGKSRASRTF